MSEQIQRYGIETLCGCCGQEGGGWSLVPCVHGPVVYAAEYEQALAAANERIVRLQAEIDKIKVHGTDEDIESAKQIVREFGIGVSDPRRRGTLSFRLLGWLDKMQTNITNFQHENESLQLQLAYTNDASGILSQGMDTDKARIAELAVSVAKLQQEVQKWQRIRTPTHGSCCTCQKCGLDYDSCRCDLDELADENTNLRQENERLTRIVITTIDTHRFESGPCYICGYNGLGYYQPDKHPCARFYHAAVEAKIKENKNAI